MARRPRAPVSRTAARTTGGLSETGRRPCPGGRVEPAARRRGGVLEGNRRGRASRQQQRARRDRGSHCQVWPGKQRPYGLPLHGRLQPAGAAVRFIPVGRHFPAAAAVVAGLRSGDFLVPAAGTARAAAAPAAVRHGGARGLHIARPGQRPTHAERGQQDRQAQREPDCDTAVTHGNEKRVPHPHLRVRIPGSSAARARY